MNKTGTIWIAACALIIASGLTLATDLEINWSSIDGGGGQSQGTDITLIGVIGQSDSARMTGGDLSLSGGYLPLPADTGELFKDGFE